MRDEFSKSERIDSTLEMYSFNISDKSELSVNILARL